MDMVCSYSCFFLLASHWPVVGVSLRFGRSFALRETSRKRPRATTSDDEARTLKENRRPDLLFLLFACCLLLLLLLLLLATLLPRFIRLYVNNSCTYLKDIYCRYKSIGAIYVLSSRTNERQPSYFEFVLSGRRSFVDLLLVFDDRS